MLQPNIAEGPRTTASRGASVERVASSIRGQLPCCKEDTAISIASFRAADIVVPLSLNPTTSRHSSFKSGLVIKTLSSRPYSTSPELERQHRILLPTRPQLTNRSPPRVNRVPFYQRLFQDGERKHIRQWLQVHRPPVPFLPTVGPHPTTC
jgi:hypothetical protein